MFREDNYIYYRPNNNSTNHADTAERPLKKKELLKEKRQKLNILLFHIKMIDRRTAANKSLSGDIANRKAHEDMVRKLKSEIASIESQTIVHRTFHKTRKLSPDKIFEYCKQAIRDSVSQNIRFMTVEDVAYQLNTPTHLVKQCFVQLNHLGWLSQAQHRLPHDCYRPDDSGWSADIYYIQKKAKEDLDQFK